MAKKFAIVLIVTIHMCLLATRAQIFGNPYDNPFNPCRMEIPFYRRPLWCFYQRPLPRLVPSPAVIAPPAPPESNTAANISPSLSPSTSPWPSPDFSPSPPSSSRQEQRSLRPENCRVETVLYDSCNPNLPEPSSNITPRERYFSTRSISTGFMRDEAGCCLGFAVFSNACRPEIRDLSAAKRNVFYSLMNACGFPY